MSVFNYLSILLIIMFILQWVGGYIEELFDFLETMLTWWFVTLDSFFLCAFDHGIDELLDGLSHECILSLICVWIEWF